MLQIRERAVLADRPSEDFVAQQQQLDAPEFGPDHPYRQERAHLEAAFPIIAVHWGFGVDDLVVAWLARRHALRPEVGRVVAAAAGLGGAR
jgi:hypothetical protein